MKFIFNICIVCVLLFCCSNKIEKPLLTLSKKIESLILKKENIEYTIQRYDVGEINGDKLRDSAFINYYVKSAPNGTIVDTCQNPNCDITINFSNGIPELIIEGSIGVYINKTIDLNLDKANEIIIFSRWFNSYTWQQISAWSLQKGKWKKLAETKVFLSEDKDYENRIQKVNSQFYLIGDNWNDSLGVEERKIKVKISENN